MPEADYLSAALPDRHIILGRLLKPFSLGHMMILRRIGSPFVKECKAEAGFSDLLIGVFVCSRTYEDALESLQNPNLPKQLKVWGKACGIFDVREKCRAFQDYIVKGSTWPEVMQEEMDGRALGTPPIQIVRLILQAKLNFGPSEAFNYPWGAAIYDYFGFLELDRKIRVVSEEDRAEAQELIERMKGMDDLLAKLEKEATGESPTEVTP